MFLSVWLLFLNFFCILFTSCWLKNGTEKFNPTFEFLFSYLAQNWDSKMYSALKNTIVCFSFRDEHSCKCKRFDIVYYCGMCDTVLVIIMITVWPTISVLDVTPLIQNNNKSWLEHNMRVSASCKLFSSSRVIYQGISKTGWTETSLRTRESLRLLKKSSGWNGTTLRVWEGIQIPATTQAHQQSLWITPPPCRISVCRPGAGVMRAQRVSAVLLDVPWLNWFSTAELRSYVEPWRSSEAVVHSVTLIKHFIYNTLAVPWCCTCVVIMIALYNTILFVDIFTL